MSELDPITEPRPTPSAKPKRTPEEEAAFEAERETLLAEVLETITNPALDDPDDEAFFGVLKPFLALARTKRFARHYRVAIYTDAWQEFTKKHYDRIHQLDDRIQAYKKALWDAECAQKEGADAS